MGHERFSVALQDDGFQHVSHVFGLVAGFLESFQQLFQLDEGDGVVLSVEEAADGLATNFVSLVLQPVYLDGVLQELAVLSQQSDSSGQLLRLLENDTGQDLGRGRRLSDLEVQKAIGGSEDKVEDVVERGG